MNGGARSRAPEVGYGRRPIDRRPPPGRSATRAHHYIIITSTMRPTSALHCSHCTNVAQHLIFNLLKQLFYVNVQNKHGAEYK